MSLLTRIPLTVRHHYDFGPDRSRVGENLVNPHSWDAVRRTDSPFRLPETRAEWEQSALGGDLPERAHAISAVARRLGARTVCSYGVGTGLLEANIARELPDTKLICTDFAPETVRRLRDLFPEADVRLHDLRTMPPPEADLHLLHRVDTELSNSEWRDVFRRLNQPVVVVVTQLVDLQLLAFEFRLRRSRPRPTRAGWSRTEAGFRRLWRSTHVDEPLQVASHRGWLLLPRAVSSGGV
jgi:hypothetical protein